jgi:DnaJ-class molecular chaperone
MRLQFDPELDYYELLQVHPKAHPEIIKRAYRTLVAQLHAHPDLGGSHQQMVLINRAYEVLSSPELRAEYDRWRQAETGAAPKRPTSAGGERVTTRGAITAVCVNCGQRNRVPHDIDLARARCGSCGEWLIPAAAAREARARRPGRGEHGRRLPQQLYNELCRDGQLRVRLDRVARGSRIVCRRCQRPWWAPTSGRPPRRCPACGSEEWLTFRLFKCSACGHEFESNSLRAWPYLLHPACPACGARNWSRAAERSPMRWVMRLLSRAK